MGETVAPKVGGIVDDARIDDMHATSDGDGRRGLTLVETVAVSATLVVLAAFLASAAAGIRGDSKASRCMLNLMQTGYASSIYAAQDPADMAIPVHPLQFAQNPSNPTFIGAYEWGGKSGIGWDSWIPGFGVLGSKYGTKAGFGPASRPLNGIIYREEFVEYGPPNWDRIGATRDTELELDVQQCSSDTGYSGVHFPNFRDSKLSSFDHFGTSYTANLFFISAAGGGTLRSNSPYLRRIADILSPTTTLAYYENNGRYGWAAGPAFGDCSFIGPAPPGPVRGWHGKDWTFNAAFIDGHADTIYMRGFSNPRLAFYPPWGGESGSFKQYQCIIVRGEGWQIDTLPGDFIQTGLQWGGPGRASWEGGIE